MGFIAFATLLVIGIVVSVVVVILPKLNIKLPGGIITAIIVGYIGARLGAIVFGNWMFLTFRGISILPAILGAVAAILLCKSCIECCKKQK